MELAWGWRPSFAAEASIMAGVTTRAGGVSPPPYDSLNVGLSVGDSPANVWENRRRLLADIGVPDAVIADQVHGTEIAFIARETGKDLKTGYRHVGEADGLVTHVPGLALVVTVADCVPVFLWAPRARTVALLHAGWRGTVAGVLTAAVERLCRRQRLTPDALFMAQGPSIGPCCYQVGAAVRRAAAASGLDDALVRKAGEMRFDLWQANQLLAQRAGLKAERLEGRPPCTSCDQRYFSHRRDGPATGRLAAVAVVTAFNQGGDAGRDNG